MIRTLKIGMSGHDVGYVHQKLVEIGADIAQAELANEVYGASTAAAIQDFQTSQRIKVDGVCGNQTLYRLDNPGLGGKFTVPDWRCAHHVPAPQQVQRVIEAAVFDLARPTYEEPPGSNSGPRLRHYHNAGLAWCGFAVSTWYNAADGGSPFGIKASALKLRDWAHERNRILGAKAPLLPGDIGIIVRASGHGHVGLIVDVIPGGKVASIEGNSGNAVRGLVRPRSNFQWYVRPLILP